MAQQPSLIMEDFNHTYNHYKSKIWDTEVDFLYSYKMLAKLSA